MKKSCLTIILFFLLSAWTVLVSAQKEWTLEACIEYALKENIMIRKVKLSLEKQKQVVNASKMEFLPTLGASVAQWFNFGKNASS